MNPKIGVNTDHHFSYIVRVKGTKPTQQTMNRIDITSDHVTYTDARSFYAEASELSHEHRVRRFNEDMVLFNPRTGNERHFKYITTNFDLRGEELTGWEYYSYDPMGRIEYTLHVIND